jgi:hypothetical protein
VGIGSGLLKDAFLRARQVSRRAGARLLQLLHSLVLCGDNAPNTRREQQQ